MPASASADALRAVKWDAPMAGASRARTPCQGRLAADELPQGEDNEFTALQRRKADNDIDDARVDIALRRCRAVATHEEGLRRSRSPKRAVSEELEHEAADTRAQLCT